MRPTHDPYDLTDRDDLFDPTDRFLDLEPDGGDDHPEHEQWDEDDDLDEDEENDDDDE